MIDDEPKTTDVAINGPAVVEIDAERIAQIIFDHLPYVRAARSEGGQPDPRLSGRGSPRGDQTVIKSLDDLAQLWAAGASFTDMGLKLGESRNVIGGRTGRARKARAPRFKPREPRRRVVKPPGEHVGNTRPLPSPPEPPRPRLLVDLGPRDCKWRVGEKDGRHLFRGQPQAPGRPYCVRHCGAVNYIALVEDRIARLEVRLKATAR